MNKGLIKKLLPHFIAVIVFLIIAVIYCSPVLQGKVVNQADVTQWKAMAKNSFDYKDSHGKFPLWTNNMFGGMPAYQIAIEPDVKVTPQFFYHVFTLGLPKPISFFFLACICFYFLSQVLRVNPYVGIIGALAFAYATYNPVLVATGHDTKMQSIAFMPALIGAIMLVYDRKYIWGAALTALFTCLLIAMNHMQIVYYSLIIAAIMTIGYMVFWIREKQWKHLIISCGIVLIAGILGVMTNAPVILTTQDAAKTTIRGGTEIPDKNATTSGLSKDYAFSYSMYKTEPFVMMVPKIYGGSDGLEIKQEESKAVQQLQQMPQELAQQLQYNLKFYWGGIGGSAGPQYVGAIICFLALIGFFILGNKHKWWILATSVLAILMSWGGYFEGFNSMLLNVLPLYNKFRAPSVILVIPTLLFCMMAVLSLQKIIDLDNKEAIWNRYKKGLILTGGLFIVLLIIYFSADFTGEQDKALMQQAATMQDQVKDYVRGFVNALKDDRKSLFFSSLIRSFFFIAAAAFMVWLRIRKTISPWITIAVIGLFAFIDLMSVNVKYLSSDNYEDELEYNQANFTATPADEQIMKDTSNYRVFDLREGISRALTYGAMTAYFHKSIGGYHPAKLSIYQDLIEHQLSKFPQSLPVVNMLNTKYIIQRDQSGKESININPDALGSAWFVQAVRYEKTAQEVMNALTGFHPKDTAIVFEKDRQLVNYAPASDSAASIQLIKNDNDEVTYRSNASSNRFAVFSEIYYDLGWKAYIDGKETPIVRTNYVLRGLSVPAGQHEIRFVFHPDSFYKGERIALIGGIIVLLLIATAIFLSFRNRKQNT